MRPKRPGVANKPPWREAPPRRADQRQGGGASAQTRARCPRTTDEPALRGLGDPDLFDVAQAKKRAVVTYNRADFEAIVREYAEVGRQHHGLVIVHPTRFPGSDIGRLVASLANLLDSPPRGKSFLVWLQEGSRASG